MLTKEECLKALCRIQCGAKHNKDCKDCACYDTKINPWKCVENTRESMVIRDLIEAYFDLLRKYEILQDENASLVLNRIADDLLSRKQVE